MPALNDKPVRLLMHDMASAFALQPGQAFSRERAVQWFAEHYPNVKEGTVTAHLIRLSTNVRTRLQYAARDDGSDDLFFKIDSSHFRLYEPGRDPIPINSLTVQSDDAEPNVPENTAAALSQEFAYEHDLRDYLVRNLHALEPGLRPYTDEGITGVEFPAGGRFIDILAVDQHGDYAVIELKVSKGYDRVVGQLLRYVNWIKEHHVDGPQKVRGMIVAKDISEDLRLACRALPDVTLYEYKLSVTVQQVSG